MVADTDVAAAAVGREDGDEYGGITIVDLSALVGAGEGVGEGVAILKGLMISSSDNGAITSPASTAAAAVFLGTATLVLSIR